MSYRRTWQRLVSILCVLLFCLTSTSAVFAASENPDAVTAPEQSAEGQTEDGASDDGTSAEEPERLEPDAYFEPIQTNEIENWPQGPAVWAESAVVMDLDSSAILYSKNMDATKYPASITKIMTALVAIENSSPNERVAFSENAIYGIERNSSHIGIRVNEILSMEDCLYGMMLESANEVCLAVAEHISGSVEGFVELMNQKAAELGCTNTHFTNPNGLPDENHYTTAHDMALIAQAAYSNKTFRQVCQTRVHCISKTNVCGEERWLGNHHKMLPEKEYTYQGCTGGKTGFTQAALNTLVTYAERDGRRLVCVSLRTNGRQIYTDTASLLDYGFNNFQNVTLHSRKTCAGVNMLHPSLYFGQPCTISALRPTCIATLPVTVTQDQLQTTALADSDTISRTYLYNQYPVGNESISASAIRTLLTHSPKDAGLASYTDQTGSLLSNLKQSAAAQKVASVTKKLPVYAYILFFILILLIILEVLLAVKKKRNRRRRKNRGKKR